jgi:hypothetical protein
MLKCNPSIPNFFRAFSTNECFILSNALCIHWGGQWLCPWLHPQAALHLLFCVHQTTLVSLEWNQTDHDVWFLKICLSIFYDRFLLLCSSRIIVCSFPLRVCSYLVLVSGFIEWVYSILFSFYVMKYFEDHCHYFFF